MNWQDFGKALFDSGDLDPVYIMLYEAMLDRHVLDKWLLAYWSFYDCGTASKIAESDDFWDGCHQAYLHKWARGSERRHFRGKQCQDSIANLATMGSPTQIISRLENYTTFAEVANDTENWRGFGPWVTWKIADMLERVLNVPINFTGTSLSMYAEPLAGAALILGKKKDEKVNPQEMEALMNEMSEAWPAQLAPPNYNRMINIQEKETVLCKFKSHDKGHYPVGHDIAQITTSLKRMPGNLSDYLLNFVPKVKSLQTSLW